MKRLTRRVAAVAAAIVIGGSVSTMAAPTAQADLLTDAACAATGWAAGYAPVTPNSFWAGPDRTLAESGTGVFTDAEMWDSTTNTRNPKFTAWEIFGDGGIQFSSSTYTAVEKERRCDLGLNTQNVVANGLFNISKWETTFALSVRQMSAKPQFLSDMMADAATVSGSLYTGLYVGTAAIMLMVVGLWMLFKAGGSSRREALAGGLWAFLCVAFGIVMMTPTPTPGWTGSTNPPRIYGWTLNATAMANTVGDGLASLLVPKEVNSAFCDLPQDAPDRGRRMADCAIYYRVLVEPWGNAQFGPAMPTNAYTVGAVSGDLRLAQIRAQAYSKGELDALASAEASSSGVTGVRARGEEKIDNKDTSTTVGQWNAVGGFLLDTSKPYGAATTAAYSDWAGHNPMDRIGAAVTSVVVATLVLVFIVVCSLLSLIWGAALVGMVMALPLVALLAIWPPAQTLGRAWVQTWVKAIILTAAYQVVQVGALVLTVAALTLPNVTMGWKAIIMMVFLFGLFQALKALGRGAGTPNFGGGEATRHFDIQQQLAGTDQAMRAAGKGPVARAIGAGLTAAGAGALVGGLSNRAVNRKADSERAAVVSGEVDQRMRAAQEQFAVDHKKSMTKKQVRDLRAHVKGEVENETAAAPHLGLQDAAKASMAGAAAGLVAGGTNRTGNPLVTGAAAGGQRASELGAATLAARSQRVQAQSAHAAAQAAFETESAQYRAWISAGRPAAVDGKPVPAEWFGGAPVAPAPLASALAASSRKPLTQEEVARVVRVRTEQSAAKFEAERAAFDRWKASGSPTTFNGEKIPGSWTRGGPRPPAKRDVLGELQIAVEGLSDVHIPKGVTYRELMKAALTARNAEQSAAAARASYARAQASGDPSTPTAQAKMEQAEQVARSALKLVEKYKAGIGKSSE